MRAHSLNHNYVASLCIVDNVLSILIFIFFQVSLLFFICIASYAQPKIKVFKKESGLSHEHVTSIVQDQSGYLWVGTRNGLNRFDGNTFKVFKYSSNDSNSISSNYISCLVVDKSNRIWIGHEAGLTRYDPALNKFTRYQLPNLPIFLLSFISIDKYDRIWIGLASFGMLVLNPETGVIERKIDLAPFINKDYNQVEFDRLNTIHAISEDSLDNVWLATRDGLYLFERKLDKVKPVRVCETGPGKYRNDYFKQILPDKEGGFWFASYRGGIGHYLPRENTFSIIQLTPKQYESDVDFSVINSVNDIAWKTEKELWFTTSEFEKSIGTYDIHSGKFTYLNSSKIFGESNFPNCTDVFVDRGGLVWVASRFGLVLINPKIAWNFRQVFKNDPSLNLNISAVVEDTIIQKRFLASMHGPEIFVSSLRDSSVHSYKGKSNPAYDGLLFSADLLDTGGDSLWVISRDNIRLFDKIKEKWISIPQLQKIDSVNTSIGPTFSKMIRASSGDYWIATVRNGAYALRGSDLSLVEFKSNLKEENSICSNTLSALLEDKLGRIWFGSRNAGISIFDPANNTFKTLSTTKKGSPLFLPANAIYEMDIDNDGNIWVATLTVGMIRINVISKDSLNISTFDQALLTEQINELKIDREGKIWFRAPNGVNILDPKTMNIKSFELKPGLFDGDFSLLKSNGRVLVNGSIGFGYIDTRDLLPDTTFNPLVINSVKVFGKEIFPDGINHDRINLSHDQNSIAIDFTTIDFVYNNRASYSYKLEGVEGSEWSAPSGNRSTEFAHLAGGDYVFKLKTSNQDGVWSKETSLLFIHIGTPYWETKWFYALLIVMGIGIIGLFNIYQINKIKDRERERSEINKRISQLQLKALHTQMRPHFIFNCLSAINSHIIKFETVKASEFLSQFSKLMRGILENSTESWITLEQELETLRLYLVMEGLRFEDKFSYTIEVEEGISPSKILIPSMIIQPYVENAIGHGLLHKEHGTGIVNIKFLTGDGNLKCIIEDNGIGRERSSQIKQRSIISRKSLGLQITSERLQLLQGSSAADIQDLKNELGEPTGTRIVIMLMTKKAEDRDLANLN
jgi:ligand-binding sensor domain-containing protein